MAVEGRRIEIRGSLVSNFQPWVFRVARQQGVAGRICAVSGGITLEVFAPAPKLNSFIDSLQREHPTSIDDFRWERIPAETCVSLLVDSDPATLGAEIRGDFAPCADCISEIENAADRRHGYAFNSCPSCGPRLSIAREFPLVRESSTMAALPMCFACKLEYENPENRRFGYELISCASCGPRLRVVTPHGTPVDTDSPLRVVARAIRAQLIVAVKSDGGFHFVCDATSDVAVSRLRERKKRDVKPFAVLVPDIEAVESYATVSEEEKQLLTSPERPLVPVLRHSPSPICADVAPNNRLIGFLLPSTPLQHLLLKEIGKPLAITSANLPNEPIASSNGEAVDQLSDIADMFLLHDREIAVRTDDSEAMVIGGRPQVIRRSRGYVPSPVFLQQPLVTPTLGCGSGRNATFCMGTGRTAFLSPHIGNLDNPKTLAAYEESIARFRKLLRFEPSLIAHDLYPGYLSTRFAALQGTTQRVAVQHHHAHIASAMAEHNLSGPVIGVAFDSGGFGSDGTFWGGEVMIADLQRFERFATIRPLRLAGGDAANRQVWRVGLAMLDDAFEGTPPLHAIPLFREIPRRAVEVVRGMIDRNTAPPAHGLGRYFDGIASVVLNRPDCEYGSQIALEWNLVADAEEKRCYPVAVREGEHPWLLDVRPMIRAAVSDLLMGISAATISARFHNTVAMATAELIRAALGRTGDVPVVLTGGCFENTLLGAKISKALGSEATVFTHREIPAGDGGVALGQVLVANAFARSGNFPPVSVNVDAGLASNEVP